MKRFWAATCLLITACSKGAETVSIAELLNNPEKFDGIVVRVDAGVAMGRHDLILAESCNSARGIALSVEIDGPARGDNQKFVDVMFSPPLVYWKGIGATFEGRFEARDGKNGFLALNADKVTEIRAIDARRDARCRPIDDPDRSRRRPRQEQVIESDGDSDEVRESRLRHHQLRLRRLGQPGKEEPAGLHVRP